MSQESLICGQFGHHALGFGPTIGTILTVPHGRLLAPLHAQCNGTHAANHQGPEQLGAAVTEGGFRHGASPRGCPPSTRADRLGIEDPGIGYHKLATEKEK